MKNLTDRSDGIDLWSKLALLRFLLAFIVAFNHLGEMVPIGAFSVIPMFGTFEAILGFLLVSGYSIGISYRKEPARFLWRRIKRIYPVYLFSLALMGFVFASGNGQGPSVFDWVANLLLLNHILVPVSIVSPAWSLSLEFWLYCLTPLLFKLSDKSTKVLVAFSFVSFCIYTCGRTLFHWDYYSGTLYGLNLMLLSFIWITGLRLARAEDAHDRKAVLNSVFVIFGVYILMCLAIQGGYRLKNGDLAQFFRGDLFPFFLRCCTLAGVGLLFANIVRCGSGGRPSAWMRYLGDISFPLYVVHLPVFELMQRSGFRSPLGYVAVALAVSSIAYLALDVYSQRRHAPKKMPVTAS